MGNSLAALILFNLILCCYIEHCSAKRNKTKMENAIYRNCVNIIATHIKPYTIKWKDSKYRHSIPFRSTLIISCFVRFVSGDQHDFDVRVRLKIFSRSPKKRNQKHQNCNNIRNCDLLVSDITARIMNDFYSSQIALIRWPYVAASLLRITAVHSTKMYTSFVVGILIIHNLCGLEKNRLRLFACQHRIDFHCNSSIIEPASPFEK